MDNNWVEHYRILHKLIERDFPERIEGESHETHWIDWKIDQGGEPVCLWCLKVVKNLPAEHCRKHLEETKLLAFL